MSKIYKAYWAPLREQALIGLNLGLLFLSGTHAVFYVSMKEILDFNWKKQKFLLTETFETCIGTFEGFEYWSAAQLLTKILTNSPLEIPGGKLVGLGLGKSASSLSIPRTFLARCWSFSSK